MWRVFRSCAVQIWRVPVLLAATIKAPSGVVEADRMVSVIPGRLWLLALRSFADAVRSWLL